MLLLYSFNSLLFLSINQLGIGAIFTASHLHVFVYGRAQLKESLVAADALCVAAQCCGCLSGSELSSVLITINGNFTLAIPPSVCLKYACCPVQGTECINEAQTECALTV